MNRDDFNMLRSEIIYLDNGATTLKPNILGEVTSDYYNNYSANAHRGDYDISLKVDTLYEEARELVKEFINAKTKAEIVFTSGTTDSLNRIVTGYFKNCLTSGDEVLLTKSEHASNVLPWFELSDELGIKINYIPLNDELKVSIDNVKNSITDKTKVISIAHVTNVAGDIRPIKEITEYAHSLGIMVVVDGAQSVPHIETDVQDLDIDFLAFSAHKMSGPTGVGVLYGKFEYLDKLIPTCVGGGMNATYSSDMIREYNTLPCRLEAGTPNIAGVIGFGAVIKYLNNIGIENIHEHEINLRKYAIDKLSKIENLTIYNPTSEGGIIAFNYQDIFSQDLAIYLNKYGICVRAGNHCSKTLKEEIGIKNTCRASLYYYNNENDIDKLVEVLENSNIKNEII